MNRLLQRYIATIAICAPCLLFTGCAGDDDDAAAQAGSPSPDKSANAPATLNGKGYALAPTGGGNAALEFDAGADTYKYTPNAGIVETGRFTAQRSGDVWNVQLISDAS